MDITSSIHTSPKTDSGIHEGCKHQEQIHIKTGLSISAVSFKTKHVMKTCEGRKLQTPLSRVSAFIGSIARDSAEKNEIFRLVIAHDARICQRAFRHCDRNVALTLQDQVTLWVMASDQLLKIMDRNRGGSVKC